MSYFVTDTEFNAAATELDLCLHLTTIHTVDKVTCQDVCKRVFNSEMAYSLSYNRAAAQIHNHIAIQRGTAFCALCLTSQSEMTVTDWCRGNAINHQHALVSEMGLRRALIGMYGH